MFLRKFSLYILFLLVILIFTPRIHAVDFTVDALTANIAADGRCSLAEAIDNANADAVVHADCPAGAGADVLILQRSLSLNGALLFAANGTNGLPSITSDIIIEGAGFSVLRSGAAPSFRIFHVAAGGTLTLNRLTIGNGLMDSGFDNGGGIYNDGTLTLTGTTVQDNRVTSVFPNGGGIYSTGTLNIFESTITRNSAVNPGSVFDNGGGIYSQGTLLMRASTVSNNTAEESAGGVYLAGNATIENSIITGNTSGQNGGGLTALGGLGTVIRINNSQFSNNTALETGGAIASGNGDLEIFGTEFLNNTVTGNPNGVGGAIANTAGTMTITNSRFQGNRTLNGAVGGAISNLQLGNMTVTGSTFTGNSSATDGGAIYASLAPTLITDSVIENNNAGNNGGGIFEDASNVDSITLVRSSVINNSAGFIGGGLANEGNQSTSTIMNSTFSGNTATLLGGGIGLNAGGQVDILHSTIADNTSTQFVNSVGGINAFAGTMTITSSIIASNNNVDCSATNASTSGDFNLTTGTGDFAMTRWCSFVPLQPNDILNTNPLLNPLANNGGLGRSYTLQAGSPAIDAIPANCPAALNDIDQRGVPRPAGSCDIGAISSDDVILPVISFQTPATTLQEGVTAGTQFITIQVDNTAGNLNAPGTLPVTIYVRRAGTATDTRDYTSPAVSPLSFVLNAGNWIAPGNIGTFQIPLDLIDDTDPEATENLRFELSVVGAGVLDAARRLHTVTFIDDDAPPPVPVAASPPLIPVAAGDTDLPDVTLTINKTGFAREADAAAIGTSVTWQITVTNNTGAPADNVTVTDTVLDALQIDSVTTTIGTVTINRQTFIISIGTLTPGQSATIDIQTTIVASGVTLANTGCVVASNQPEVICASALALTENGIPAGVTALPATGERPGWWRLLLFLLD